MANYEQMWKDIGMDVEAHAPLLQVLPEAYGSVYMSQEKRPENMSYYDFVVSEIHGFRVKELLEHKEKGGKVFGTFCIFVPMK